ncbi:Uncharacterized protein APZ42_004427 [Daphnia magna]|uniref:Uncharacterized protein n=1 Tax=Daphnia magna TaxID=35525 RepID=A0A164H2J3_9CRUS|nr:Uncharacterized protein APZ42_004427 [Daphnia magna]
MEKLNEYLAITLETIDEIIQFFIKNPPCPLTIKKNIKKKGGKQ